VGHHHTRARGGCNALDLRTRAPARLQPFYLCPALSSPPPCPVLLLAGPVLDPVRARQDPHPGCRGAAASSEVRSACTCALPMGRPVLPSPSCPSASHPFLLLCSWLGGALACVLGLTAPCGHRGEGGGC